MKKLLSIVLFLLLATTLVTCRFISSGANLNTVTGSTGRVILTTRLLP